MVILKKRQLSDHQLGEKGKDYEEIWNFGFIHHRIVSDDGNMGECGYLWEF